MFTRNNMRDKMEQCPICGKQYKNYNTMMSHKSRTHRGIKSVKQIKKPIKKIAVQEPEEEENDEGLKETKEPGIEESHITIVNSSNSADEEEGGRISLDKEQPEEEDSEENNDNEDNGESEETEIDMEELNSMPADTLNTYFKNKRLSQLTDEEYSKLTHHTGVMLKKRLPKILFKYGDIVNVVLSGGKIVYKRINQANEIAALRAQYKKQQEEIKKEERPETKVEKAEPKDSGYSGKELEELQKKYHLIKE